MTEGPRARSAANEDGPAAQFSAGGYLRVLERLPAGVVVHAPDTSVLYANAKACEFLGLSPEEISGKHAIDQDWCFFREDGSPMPLSEYPVQRVLSTRDTLEGLVVGINRPRSGDRAWALVNAFADVEDGELRRVVVTFVDLTGERRARGALVESERLARESLETAMVAEREAAALLRFETLLADISSRLASAEGDELDAAIDGAQRRICDELDFDYSTIYQLADETAHPTHFHVRVGIRPSRRRSRRAARSRGPEPSCSPAGRSWPHPSTTCRSRQQRTAKPGATWASGASSSFRS